MNRRWLAVGAVTVVAVPGLLVGLPVLLMVSGGGGASAASASSCPAGSASAYTLTASSLNAEQVQNAETIIGVGAGLVGPVGEVIAVDASLTEASLINNPGGDLDSAGLFQMRPSQGWGSYQQVTDPVYASTKFYSVLVGIDGWSTLPPGVAEQDVERSAFPDRYATHLAEAQAIVDAATPTGTQPCETATLPGTIPAAAAAAISQAPAQVQVAIAYAAAQLGKPYLWGGTGPAAYDCSGLTERAYEAAGVEITRTTWSQVDQGTDVTGGPYLPGDLLFPEPGHVELYIGAGFAIQAPHTGLDVMVSPTPDVWDARRIVAQ